MFQFYGKFLLGDTIIISSCLWEITFWKIKLVIFISDFFSGAAQQIKSFLLSALVFPSPYFFHTLLPCNHFIKIKICTVYNSDENKKAEATFIIWHTMCHNSSFYSICKNTKGALEIEIFVWLLVVAAGQLTFQSKHHCSAILFWNDMVDILNAPFVFSIYY